jgi:sugar lactone lactonase YvrE
MAEVTVLRTKTPVDGFRLAEGPRWRDGRLWISDIFARRAHTVALDGTVETVAAGPQTSTLGFL